MCGCHGNRIQADWCCPIAIRSLLAADFFSAGESVDANRLRVMVERLAAAAAADAHVAVGVLAVADVHVAVGALAVAAWTLGDCAFPAAASSAVADVMSVADEVAADEPRVAPDVHCRAVLAGLRVSRDVQYRAVRDDLHQVSRGVPCRAVPGARLVRLGDPHPDLQVDPRRGDLHRVVLVGCLADRGDCCQGDPGARLQAVERRD